MAKILYDVNIKSSLMSIGVGETLTFPYENLGRTKNTIRQYAYNISKITGTKFNCVPGIDAQGQKVVHVTNLGKYEGNEKGNDAVS